MATRVTGFWMTAQLASAFGPILAYALSLISVGDGIYTAGWRWMCVFMSCSSRHWLILRLSFIVEGIITIVAGLLAPFFLLEFPERAKFLNEREKHVATERMQLERDQRSVVHPTAWETVKTLADWKILSL